jgi:hypothetical protein
VDVKEAAKLAKDYVADLFAEEGIGNLGLEEIELVADGHYWVVTVGFSRPWDQGGLATITLGQRGLRRSFKVLRIDNQSRTVDSIKDRILQGAE